MTQLNFNEFSSNSEGFTLEALEAQLKLHIQRKQLTKAIELLERFKIKPEEAIATLRMVGGIQ